MSPEGRSTDDIRDKDTSRVGRLLTPTSACLAELQRSHDERILLLQKMEEELLESEQRYGSRPRKSEPEAVEQTCDRSRGAVMRSEATPSVSRADSLKERLEKKLGLERRIDYELAKALSEADLRSELHQERERRRQARLSRLMGHRRDERIAEAQKRKTAEAMRLQASQY
ncbi:hypothetical protein FOZ61_005311 [Perkinsus olseni]|uniref:Uncharacterized protein n=1 Tax=Perkinsus olseni TaxID=32597 RepID=A0A7J6LHV6_PEROL|nr:hypothetical protein FOZ61_005311 [Perkinsus olseni]